jgi:UDP-N-acetylglucosamine--N-acetylmuramyl-(pentapeptide) pyrophosphoryl-undecaprenol N-acetylglucosamine transferase
LWVGGEGGMERDLVKKAGIDFVSIPAAGLHGVGICRLPGNAVQVFRGLFAARRLLHRYKPDLMFFTGGYVAVPIALVGHRTPTVLFVPDIEPGMALKLLARFADRIALTAEDSKAYFPKKKGMVVTGYPVRSDLSEWKKDEAYNIFGLSPKLPTLLVTGGSLGSLTINRAIAEILPKLLKEMQIIHLTGKLTWPQFENVRESLTAEDAQRYRSFPYLHKRMGAAYTISDLVISRAGASSLGEYPHFGLPAILVPYPYAWRYQKVNADYLVRKNAALILEDSEMEEKLLPLITELMRDQTRRNEMKDEMRNLSGRNSAALIANLISETATLTNHVQ